MTHDWVGVLTVVPSCASDTVGGGKIAMGLRTRG